MLTSQIESSARSILALLLEYRREAKPRLDDCPGHFCQRCHKPHIQLLMQAIKAQQPILLILPAFPAKSANRKKTLSAKPDLAETMGLINLNKLCAKINSMHAPGIKLLICSDGRVFNDLIAVSDNEVDLYQQGIKTIIEQSCLTHLDTFALDEIYPADDYVSMRNTLMNDYGESLEKLKHRLVIDRAAMYQFNGIHRFVFEDQLFLNPQQSKNQTRKQSKEIAYEVIRRSNAWSRLLARHFPQGIRLSIHPQPCGSEKLGIKFLPASDRWATPWHNVLLKNKQGWQLMKRVDAEKLGAKLHHDHYVLETCA